jgi:hypothetical protein
VAFTVARRSGISAVAWGLNNFGQCDVPPLPPGLTYVDVDAGYGYAFARRSDGSIVSWGDGSGGQRSLPALPAGTSYVILEAGTDCDHPLAVRSDGAVVTWGVTGSDGLWDVPALPANTAYVGVAAGSYFSLALRSDGSVVGWGWDQYGQCTLPSPGPDLACAEIAAGNSFTVMRLESRPASSYCLGDGTGTACPCGNAGTAGNGCANSSGKSARLVAMGTSVPDSIRFTVTGEMPSALTMVLQGTASVGPFPYGDGLRCVGGSLKRLYAKHASGGTVFAPASGDLSVRARSAQLGATIPAGAVSHYMAYYRDPSPSFCPAPAGGTFNASNALTITW